jgi:hypothetical protein
MKARITVIRIPHPNPQRAINLIAEIALKQIIQEETLNKVDNHGT